MTIKEYCLPINKLLEGTDNREKIDLFLRLGNQYVTDKKEALSNIDRLWEDYFQRCQEIIAPISIKPYKDTRTFGKPTHYDYLNNKNTEITMIIKSFNRATVELYFSNGIAKKEQFILKKDNDNWIVDTKKI